MYKIKQRVTYILVFHRHHDTASPRAVCTLPQSLRGCAQERATGGPPHSLLNALELFERDRLPPPTFSVVVRNKFHEEVTRRADTATGCVERVVRAEAHAEYMRERADEARVRAAGQNVRITTDDLARATNLTRPCCGTLMTDFTECLVVNCDNPSCGKFFCGVCLAEHYTTSNAEREDPNILQKKSYCDGECPAKRRR